MTEQTALVEYIRQPENLAQFEQILGKGANSYVQSVAIAVKENPALLECSYESIVNSALRSASLGLSCDPSVRQAYIIPRSKKINGKYVKVAQFQPHYNGLYNLAQRTGKYRYISVNPIYEGETVYENVSTGLHVYAPPQSTTLLMPDKGRDGLHSGYREVTSGKNTNKIIGYIGYFKTNKGFEKSVWMTVEEIEKHAKDYSDSYSKDFSAWKDPKKRPTMQMKTVLIALLKWADLSGTENTLLTQALESENEEETIEGETSPIQEEPQVSQPEEVIFENTQEAEVDWVSKIKNEFDVIPKENKPLRQAIVKMFREYEPSANISLVKDVAKLEECYNKLIQVKQENK